MLNKPTLQTAVVLTGSLRNRSSRPNLATLFKSVNESLYRALSSHFDVTYK